MLRIGNVLFPVQAAFFRRLCQSSLFSGLNPRKIARPGSPWLHRGYTERGSMFGAGKAVASAALIDMGGERTRWQKCPGQVFERENCCLEYAHELDSQ